MLCDARFLPKPNQFYPDWDTLKPYHERIAELEAQLAQPEQEPVAWIEHEWSGTGVTHFHFDQRKPTLRDEVLNPVWTPLYALDEVTK